MNVILGALISAAIPFIGGVMLLFSADASLEFSDILTASWVTLCGTALVAFLKGTQSLTVRRVINKVTNTGDGGGTI